MSSDKLMSCKFIKSSDLFCPADLYNMFKEKILQENAKQEEKKIDRYQKTVERMTKQQPQSLEPYDVIWK